MCLTWFGILGLSLPRGVGSGRLWERLGGERGFNLWICAGLAWIGGCCAVWDGVKYAGL